MKSFFCFAALLLMACLPCFAATMSPAEKQVFDDLNQERAKNGLAALEWNDQAAVASRTHSQSMLENGRISHQFTGEPMLMERLGATGVRFTMAAENIARVEFIEDVVPALMTSPGHRANMLNVKYNAVGIGVVQRGKAIYATQDFVYSIPDYSEEQFSAALEETLYDVRKAKGMSTFKISQDAALRREACATDGNAVALAGVASGMKQMVVFSSSDPRELYSEVRSFALNPAYHRISFSVCFRPDQTHGRGNFWVVAAFGN